MDVDSTEHERALEERIRRLETRLLQVERIVGTGTAKPAESAAHVVHPAAASLRNTAAAAHAPSVTAGTAENVTVGTIPNVPSAAANVSLLYANVPPWEAAQSPLPAAAPMDSW